MAKQEKEFKSLREKRKYPLLGDSLQEYVYNEEDIKEKIQNAQRRLKEILENDPVLSRTHYIILMNKIDKIFKEEFGNKLI